MSKEIVNKDRKLAIHKQSDQELKDKEPVLKREIGIMTLWFGKQKEDDAGYEQFEDRITSSLKDVHIVNFYVPNAGVTNDIDCYRPVFPEIIKAFKEINNPLAIFIIATPKVVELGHTDSLPREILKYRFASVSRPTFTYKIIYGSGSTSLACEGRSRFTKEEIRSKKLGGIFVSFNGDYPTASTKRLIEIMKRILGYDLPGEEFPDYTHDEVEKIARNANRENFNAFSTRMGAIPKYPIVSGRPVFPF